ncbi:MAG: choice-of-anchor L domain-containing protein, partial [Bacteroidota bacterium]|nr:choice-of-anchor L domain-containing protein [Bacteroidota bacterium]
MAKRFFLFLPALMVGGLAFSQITVDNSLTPQEYVEQVLVGGGVQVMNVTYNGQANTPAGQDAIGSFQSMNTILPLDSGLVLSSGGVLGIPTGGSFASGSGLSQDPDLLSLSGQLSINDQSILEFDFIPTGDTISFNYIFASYEYTSFTCTQYNDAFGFFLSGPGISGPYSNNAINIAVVPNTNIPITINTINSGQPSNPGGEPTCAAADPNWQANSIYYVDNDAELDMNFNGMTVTLTAWAEVVCGQTYHIKLAIGDAVDSGLDSGVFLEGGSFSSTGQVLPELVGGVGVDGNSMIEGCGPFEMVFTRLGDLTEEATIYLTMGGTAAGGNDYIPSFPDEIYFGPNVETISLWLDVPSDADGPEILVIDILQTIACANQDLTTTFTFDIDSPLPLSLDSYDVNSACGETHVLDPQVTGGLGEYVYEWSTGEDSSTVEVSPGVTTTYQLTVSDACDVASETVEYTISLPIYLPLELTMGPDTPIDCLGNDDIYVEDVTGGNNEFEFVWTLNGEEVGTGQTINVPASAPVYYVVTITEGCGTSIQDSLMVSTVPLDPIVIETTGDASVICSGDSLLFGITGVTGGNGVYTYQWQDQFGQMMGTDTELTVEVIADHTYTITAEDECQNTGTTTITAILPVYQPFILNLPANTLICAGDSLDLFAQVTGGSGYYFLQWQDLDHTDPVLLVMPWNDTQY